MWTIEKDFTFDSAHRLLDNGAFRAWRAGKPFDVEAFTSALEIARPIAPDFVVAPDVVAGGVASLEVSRAWLPRLEGFRAYLAVQDGMSMDTVNRNVNGFAGLFVGGTMKWKLDTGYEWVQLAHSLGLPCHVGQVGNARHARWALEIGADSIDSCKPLWCLEYLEDFADAVRQTGQGSLFTSDSTALPSVPQ